MNKKRQAVFDKSGGRCWYCGCDLSDKRWQEDHFYPVVRVGGKMLYPELDTFESKVPSCAPCNNFKSSMNIDAFRHLVSEQFTNVPKASTGMRQLMRLNLVDMESKPVKFWFEKNGLSVKSENELCNISDVAQAIEWKQDHSEFELFYAVFDGFVCSLRRMDNYWLAIATNYEWERLGEERFANGRLAKPMAAQWALSLQEDQQLTV